VTNADSAFLHFILHCWRSRFCTCPTWPATSYSGFEYSYY